MTFIQHDKEDVVEVFINNPALGVSIANLPTFLLLDINAPKIIDFDVQVTTQINQDVIV